MMETTMATLRHNTRKTHNKCMYNPPPCNPLHSNLMAPQDLKELGLAPDAASSKSGKSKPPSSREKTKRGFVAGLQ